MGKKKSNGLKSDGIILPLIILDNIVLSPQIPQPVKIDNPDQAKVFEKCSNTNSEIFVTAGLSDDEGGEDKAKLCRIGLVCLVDRVLNMPGAPSLVFLRPLIRAELINEVYSPSQPMAKVKMLPAIEKPKRKSKLQQEYIELINNVSNSLLNFMADPEKATAQKIVEENSVDQLTRLYAISHVSPISLSDKYLILECDTFNSLLEVLAEVLDMAMQKIKIQEKIHERTHHELSQQQKEAFLRTHLRQIQNELGEDFENEDIEKLSKIAETKKWNKDTEIHFKKELGKLRRLNINNPEYSVQYSYLENFLGLPWENYKESDVSIDNVKEILDRDHYGLEKVKERVLEYMAVIKLRNDLKAPIICLYGPPGVGKTSIGKSIAEALQREYARIALGGMHDESEIRGHRRTYIGAMPGRFLQSLSKLEYGNPLMLLDEIDKVGNDYKGDPSAALLEALDPEQNNTFHDNFIDYPYDLSKVLFIATANDLSTIPAPLKDRMEIIEMTGYIPEEKREIALRHLVAKALRENGLNEKEVTFAPDAIDTIIRFYTREAGVRQLEKKIGKIIRKLALMKATEQKTPKKITKELAEKFLGKQEVNPDSFENNDFAGVVPGLAWTPSGGDILYIETSLSPGKGEKINLTGNLGKVMKESAEIALQYVKAHALEMGISPEVFGKFDVHIHVPDGAVPKDGPSAGVTIATSLVSALTGKKVRERLAMTGEITLRGKVTSVGGVKEKIIAARDAGINTVILSELNKKDIEEISPQYLAGLNFIYVNTISDVIREALLDEEAPYRYNLNSPIE